MNATHRLTRSCTPCRHVNHRDAMSPFALWRKHVSVPRPRCGFPQPNTTVEPHACAMAAVERTVGHRRAEVAHARTDEPACVAQVHDIRVSFAVEPCADTQVPFVQEACEAVEIIERVILEVDSGVLLGDLRIDMLRRADDYYVAHAHGQRLDHVRKKSSWLEVRGAALEQTEARTLEAALGRRDIAHAHVDDQRLTRRLLSLAELAGERAPVSVLPTW